MRKYRNYEESLKARLADSEYAKAYLAVALEEYEADDNIEAFCWQSETWQTLKVVYKIIESFGREGE